MPSFDPSRGDLLLVSKGVGDVEPLAFIGIPVKR